MKTSDFMVLFVIGVAMFLGTTSCVFDRRNKYTNYSIQDLISILAVPDSDEFVFAANELAIRGPAAAEAAPSLALALQHPRRDSFHAGIALFAIGPSGKAAIPSLIEALDSNRPQIGQTAALALASMDSTAYCAVPSIASLLWDEDPVVRSASAASLEYILKIDLVDYQYEFHPSQEILIGFHDEPEGDITSLARDWWLNEGINQNWEERSPYCD